MNRFLGPGPFRNALIFVAAAAAIFGGAFALAQLRGGAAPPRRPLAAAPADANLVVRVDVAEVLRSPVFVSMMREDRGLQRVRERCGYNPLEEVDRAVIFATGAEARPGRPAQPDLHWGGEAPEAPGGEAGGGAFAHFGFVAQGPVARGATARQRLARCVEQVVRWGHLERTEIEGVEAYASSRGDSVAAFWGSEELIGGDREGVTAALRVARGRAPNASTEAALRELWARVDPGSQVALVGRIPPHWHEALGRIGARLGGELASLDQIRAFAGGLRLGQSAEALVILEAGSEAGSGPIAAGLRAIKERLLGNLLLRITAAGPLLRALQVEAVGSEVRLRARLGSDQLLQLRELLTSWARGQGLGGVGGMGDVNPRPPIHRGAHPPRPDLEGPDFDDEPSFEDGWEEEDGEENSPPPRIRPDEILRPGASDE